MMELLTVLLTTQKGSENTELESDAYRVVSFSAPSKMASSNNIAAKKHIVFIQLLDRLI